jgi:hypothetical protein
VIIYVLEDQYSMCMRRKGFGNSVKLLMTFCEIFFTLTQGKVTARATAREYDQGHPFPS